MSEQERERGPLGLATGISGPSTQRDGACVAVVVHQAPIR